MLKIIFLLIFWDNLDIDHAAHICYFYHTIINCLVVISKYCWIYKKNKGGLLPVIASFCFKMTISNTPPHSRAHLISHSFAFTCCQLQPDEVSLSQQSNFRSREFNFPNLHPSPNQSTVIFRDHPNRVRVLLFVLCYYRAPNYGANEYRC